MICRKVYNKKKRATFAARLVVDRGFERFTAEPIPYKKTAQGIARAINRSPIGSTPVSSQCSYHARCVGVQSAYLLRSNGITRECAPMFA